MIEKIGRVRSYSVVTKTGFVTFEDSSNDVPIHYYTLQKNGLELLKRGQKVLVVLEQKGIHIEITAIELLPLTNEETL